MARGVELIKDGVGLFRHAEYVEVNLAITVRAVIALLLTKMSIFLFLHSRELFAAR